MSEIIATNAPAQHCWECAHDLPGANCAKAEGVEGYMVLPKGLCFEPKAGISCPENFMKSG